ncbi:MAG: FxLYD domain-containing protein [Candidatus Rokubacteria bacterium]|nr:FxLYD domain-containing protein [Candidatus Rokubacteria bacterium]
MSPRRSLRALLGAVAAAAALLPATPAMPQGVQPAPGAEQFFTIELDPELAIRAGPALKGFVRNHTANRVGDLRLHAEVLDASGQVIAHGNGWVYGAIAPGSRTLFLISIPQRGAGYRITVVSYNWLAIGSPVESP